VKRCCWAGPLFSVNYTFWLTSPFGALAVYLWRVNRAHPMDHGAHGGHGAEVSPRGV